jgi:hypothetical protein
MMALSLIQGTAWRVATLAAAVGLTLSLAFLAQPVSADPPGNNGTVKIDGIPFDAHPDNEPHPGCVFQVDFYGYDEGDLYASVLFEAWPPTGAGDGDVLLFEDGIFIGEDDSSGGGSEAGLDASRTYDLTDALAGYEAHPIQGYHVKLTVHADGSQGDDRKHKVFWVECDVTPSPSPTASPSPTETASPTASPSPTETASPTASPSPTETASPTASPSPTATEGVGPGQESPPPTQREGQLPGVPTGPGGQLPDTAVAPSSGVLPAAVLAILMVISLLALATARLAPPNDR